MKLLLVVPIIVCGSLLTLSAARARAQGAAIEGKVQLPKAAASVVVSQRYQGTGTGTRTQVIAPDPPAAVLFLEGDFPVKAPLPSAPVQLAQRNMVFVPTLLPIRVGTTVEFPNQDDFYHNVFSYSKPKRFDAGRYRREEKPSSQTFDKPGAVLLHCEIHEHMRGIILVLESPYFVRTDAEGNYRLTGLPAGRYTLKAWLNDKTVLERPVELKDKATLRVDFP